MGSELPALVHHLTVHAQVKVNVEHYTRIARRDSKCYVCNRGLSAAELQEFLRHQVRAEGVVPGLVPPVPGTQGAASWKHHAWGALHALLQQDPPVRRTILQQARLQTCCCSQHATLACPTCTASLASFRSKTSPSCAPTHRCLCARPVTIDLPAVAFGPKHRKLPLVQDTIANQYPEQKAKMEREAVAVKQRLAKLQELQPLSARAQARPS